MRPHPIRETGLNRESYAVERIRVSAPEVHEFGFVAQSVKLKNGTLGIVRFGFQDQNGQWKLVRVLTREEFEFADVFKDAVRVEPIGTVSYRLWAW